MIQIFILLFLPILLYAQNNTPIKDTEVYIKLRTLKSTTSTVDLKKELGFLPNISNNILATKPFFNTKSQDLKKIYRVKISSDDINALILKIKDNPDIDYIEKVPARFCISTPNDPSVSSQWSLAKVKAFDAWDINAGTNIIKIAVVDNAVQSNHVDLQANMLAGFDVADNDTNPNPVNTSFDHGTHVAGIIGAVSNNGIGIASVGNNKIRIIPVKATSDLSNPRSIDAGYEGIVWAADNGANIINCSWGGDGFVQTEKLIIDYALAKGCMIVAAAGNSNDEVELYPAAYPGVISVASTDVDDKKSSFSSYGTWVDISAPGRGILSSIPTNAYASFGGTSMAAPLVAACLGFIWSCKPSLTIPQLENLIKVTADDIEGLNPTYLGKMGAGRINLLKAISCQELNLIEANISTIGSTYFCKGENVILNSSATGLQSSEWFKNGITLGLTQNSITVTDSGLFQLKITNGSCSIVSKSKALTINKNISPSPVIENKFIPYCSTNLTDKILVSTVQTIDFKGPKAFNYTGGPVGYDNFESSSTNPKILVSGIGGLLANISVSITWQKKDQGLYNSCDLVDQGSFPYNEEVSFKIKSPSGKIIGLINAGTYGKGTTTSGVITTTFQDGSPSISNGSLPSSGIFSPAESLSGFLNEIPAGYWEIIPNDDSFGDPLCVTGFSITLSSAIINTNPEVTWWDSKVGGNLIQTGLNYTSTATNIGKYNYFLKNKYEGTCESERILASLEIHKIPEIKATKIDIIYNPNATFNTPTISSPITFCNTEYYVLTALGCGASAVNWSNAQSNNWIHVVANANQSFTANCQTYAGGCPIIQSDDFKLISANSASTLITQNIAANANQTFILQNLKASNKIATPAKIEYNGTKSVELNPGFEVSGNSVFKAEIKGCTN